jgi:hypothetical protein
MLDDNIDERYTNPAIAAVASDLEVQAFADSSAGRRAGVSSRPSVDGSSRAQPRAGAGVSKENTV